MGRVSDATAALAPASVAAGLAPIIDRLRISIARRVPERAGELAGRLDLSPSAMQTFSMLRNAMPDRTVERAGLRAVFAYTPAEQVEAAVAELAQRSLLTAVEGGALALTDDGRERMTELHAALAATVDELWAGHEVTRLAALADRAVAAAATTGGPAFAVVAPPWEPPGASTALLLAERLTPLRFHRFDAHVAAWRSAGLTAESVQHLPPGEARDAIEATTNELAAAPYEALTPAERFELCVGLGALPS